VTHMRQLDESEGRLGKAEKSDQPCPSCGSAEHHQVRVWESNDGAYEDEKHECTSCGHVWWVDGIDS
jgi:uncharacterized Zn finger protein